MGGTFNWSTAVTSGNPSLVRPIGTSDHILGNPAAPIVIVEYCDFTSDFCKGFSHALHQIVATEGARGEVAWAYRAFPLAETEGDALAHARAAECVAKVAGNDAFWSFADLLYAEQPVKPAQYGELAQKAGITGTSFATCYADAANQVDARIEADRKNALDIGASGAPYSILLINGRAPAVLDGAYTYDALRQVLDEALGQ
jgi:protein-disulfide isomerase